jgi:hypothetical protein
MTVLHGKTVPKDRKGLRGEARKLSAIRQDTETDEELLDLVIFGVPWDNRHENESKESLEASLTETIKQIFDTNKKLKWQVSMDVTYWTCYLDLAKMKQDQIAIEAELRAARFKDTNSSFSWQSGPAAMDKSKDKFDSWTQIGQIVKTHAKKLVERMRSEHESWVRLIATSKVGLGLDGGVGQRDNTVLTKMRETMGEAYCPDAEERELWDPVFAKWESALVMKVAHLFSWKQNRI